MYRESRQYGNALLQLAFEPKTRTARIQGQQIHRQNAASPVDVLQIALASEEIRRFLRCELMAPGRSEPSSGMGLCNGLD